MAGTNPSSTSACTRGLASMTMRSNVTTRTVELTRPRGLGGSPRPGDSRGLVGPGETLPIGCQPAPQTTPNPGPLFEVQGSTMHGRCHSCVAAGQAQCRPTTRILLCPVALSVSGCLGIHTGERYLR